VEKIVDPPSPITVLQRDRLRKVGATFAACSLKFPISVQQI